MNTLRSRSMEKMLDEIHYCGICIVMKVIEGGARQEFNRMY